MRHQQKTSANSPALRLLGFFPHSDEKKPSGLKLG